MTTEIRVSPDDWPEECKRLHRQGFAIKNMRLEDGVLVATIQQRTETRVEQPDTTGDASREVSS